MLIFSIYKAFVLRIESKIFIKSKKIKFQKNRNLVSNFHIVEDGFRKDGKKHLGLFLI